MEEETLDELIAQEEIEEQSMHAQDMRAEQLID